MTNVIKMKENYKENLLSGCIVLRNKVENILICEKGNDSFDDGGIVNFLKKLGIGAVFTGILMVLMKAFAPDFFSQMTSKVLSVIN